MNLSLSWAFPQALANKEKSNSCSHHFHAIKIFAKKKIMLNITNFLDENSFRITKGTPQYHPSLPFPISDG